MALLRNAVANSLASVSEFGDEEHRLAEIHSVDNTAKRTGLLAVHKLVTHFPKLIPEQYHPILVQIGAGKHSTVYRYNEDTVLKVIKEDTYYTGSYLLSKTERERLACKLRDQHNAMSSYLGSSIVPHEIEVGTHPLDPEQEAILIWQPYRTLDFLKLNVGSAGISAIRGNLAVAEQLHPGIINQVQASTVGNRAMQTEAHLVMDYVGNDNAGADQDTGEFAVIDSQPVAATDARDYELASAQLDRVEQALSHF